MVLRGGAGVSMALPWMHAMADTKKSQASTDGDGKLDSPPVRAAFLFMPNGVNPKNWTPKKIADSDQYELTPMLRPLANVKDKVILLENLHHPNLNDKNGHWPKVPAFLSGGHVLRTSGRDLDTGNISADQLLAAKIGDRTPLPSFELGVDSAYTGVDNVGGGFTRIYGSHIAWRDPHTPVPKEIIPQLAFDRLFRGGAGPDFSGLSPNQPKVIESLRRDDTSVLDLVSEDARSLERRLGRDDRTKLDEYLASVRSVERRIESALRPQKRWINEGRFDVSRPIAGVPEQHIEHVRLMLDIMVLAFWTDTTRISTFMFGNAQTGRNFAFIDGVTEGSFHGISHHRDEPKRLAQYEKIGTWHIEQLAYVIDRMRSLSEGDSTLLDNSMVFFGSTIRDGNKHDTDDLPLILAGGGGRTIRSGRRLTAPEKTPLCNLYRAMMQRMGVEVEKFGTSTGLIDLA
jgi:hypothetical protein